MANTRPNFVPLSDLVSQTLNHLIGVSSLPIKMALDI